MKKERIKDNVNVILLGGFILLMTLACYKVESMGWPYDVNAYRIHFGLPKPWLTFTKLDAPPNAPLKLLPWIDEWRTGLKLHISTFILYLLVSLFLGKVIYFLNYMSSRRSYKQIAIEKKKHKMFKRLLVAFPICAFLGSIAIIAFSYSESTMVMIIPFLTYFVAVPALAGILFLPFRRYFPAISGLVFCYVSFFWAMIILNIFTEYRADFDFEVLLVLIILISTYSILFILITFISRYLIHRKLQRIYKD